MRRDLVRRANRRPFCITPRRSAATCLGQGTGHGYIRPATPRLRIETEEFYRLLDGVVLGDLATFNNKLKEREDYHRPHGGLAGQTPYERLLQKTQPTPNLPTTKHQQHG